MNTFPALLAIILFTALPGTALSESQCFGTVSNGRIEHSVKLPESGPNFTAYSSIAVAAGRTHVHSRVAAILAASYHALHTAHSELTYVYGEAGWPSGGRFQPHRTHQNGLSVDFFVPVRNAEGRSVALPTSPGTRFGYDIEFDRDSRFGEYSIDYEALAEHLYQLDIAARRQGSGIALVIFENAYLPRLFATRRGPYLKDKLHFMKGKPWVRHDEHYHVDFAVPCRAASAS
jgi:penicillin-insensitive murein endopeptidase